MIAVTGAAGKTGRAVVAALAARGAAVRALVRREEQIEPALGRGAREASVVELEDRAALERAFAGARVLYLICPNVHPEEVAIGRRAIAACRRAGVERLVYHSVLHPQIEAMPHHWQKLRVEEALVKSGLEFTILQPAAYIQNVRGGWAEIVGEGVYRVPYAATTRLSLVDLADVAAAAARVATEPGHDRAIYELAGPEALDQNEIAAALAAALGRPVRLAVTERAAWGRGARAAGLSAYAVESLSAMFEHYERHGFCGNPRVLAALLGRAPARFAEVVRGWAADPTLGAS